MKQWKECTRFYSLDEQRAGHLFLAGFLLLVVVIGNLVSTGSPEAGSPVYVISIIAALSVGYLVLISTNRITYIDESGTIIEVRWFIFYGLCFWTRTIPVKDVMGLTLTTITDTDGDKAYALYLEVFPVEKSLTKPTSTERTQISFSSQFAPILKSGEAMTRLTGTKLTRNSK